MSASKKKNTAEKRLSKKAVLGIVAAVLAVLLIAGSFFINSNYFYNKTTAVSIGETDYTTAEFNYFYFSTYQQFYSGLGDYASQIIDTSRPLKDQYYTEDQSYYDFLKETALAQMIEATVAYDAAKAAGMSLSEESLKAIDEEMETVELYASLSGMTADQYLAQTYGKGASVDVIRAILNKAFLATEYYNKTVEGYSYNTEELKAHYAENKDEFDIFTYNVFYIPCGDDAEAAYTAADAVATAKDSAEFAQLVREYAAEDEKEFYADDEATLYILSGYNLSAYEDYADWLMDSSRMENDTTVILSGSGQGYYVLMFIDRENNDYRMPAMRHILVKVERDENGEYTDEAKAEAEAKIYEIKELWESGARTEDSFAELANEMSEDEGSNTTGGLYENILKNQMFKPVNDFLFLPRRVTGDIGVVFVDSANYTGYHLLYFVRHGDNYADYIADQSMRSGDYNQWMDGQFSNYPVVEHYSMRFAG